MSLKPLCFVVIPFGQKPDPVGGAEIDFGRIYTTALAPAIEDADMEPIRADEERTGGIIHKPMFERLLLGQSPLEAILRGPNNPICKLNHQLCEDISVRDICSPK